MRMIPLLCGALLATIAAAPPVGADSTVTIRGSKKQATTEGQVLLGASPEVVYDVVTDYAAWTNVFTDITSVNVKKAGRNDAVVRIKSRAMSHNVTIRFDNEPGRVIRFKLVDAPWGARAAGEFVLEPEGSGTRVRATLYMDMVGAVGFFVPNNYIRKTREAKLRTDLADLLIRFP